MNPKVDAYLQKAKSWQSESKKLQSILLEFPLREELKWGEPCYTFQEKNVILIGGFKEYATLLFFKGALMPDPQRILVTPGRTQAGRQIRFTSLKQIVEMEAVIRVYVTEAIEVEESGRRVQLKAHAEYAVPEELKRRLDATPQLSSAFEALTPGRQRAYLLHISKPKQAKTREKLVEACISRILDGKGLND